MNIITLDFETYFDSDYTLSKMTTEAYIRDPRFEVHGVAVLYGDGRREWWAGDGLKGFLRSSDGWKDCAVLCHHAAFDGLILSHHYGVEPGRWLDTYSMAAYLYGRAPKSLEALAERFELAPKTVPYDMMKGYHWRDLSPYARAMVSQGALHDCVLTRAVFDRMMQEFPACELPLIDATIRMFTEPKLIGDQALLTRIKDEEALTKNERLYELGVGERDLASTPRFKALLEAAGAVVGMKQGKNGLIPALAKSDSFMAELLNSGDEQIRTLAEARLSVMSTIDETRSARLLSCAGRGPLPVYLHYSGAHNRRWSGGDGLNFQNFGRTSGLRHAIRAPEGYFIARPDQSQGECRFLNWFAGQEDVTERFRAGLNPYEPIASKYYCRPITKANDPAEYGFGKQLELSCGYGAGWLSIQHTAARGAYGPPVHLNDAACREARDLYRLTHPQVVSLWHEARWLVLPALLAGQTGKDMGRFLWRDLLDIRDGRIYHPNGSWLDYSGLRWEEGEWRLYKGWGEWERMYGVKLIAHVISWLSRIKTGEAILRYREMGYSVAGTAHDDVWLLISGTAPYTAQHLIARVMAETPAWAPGLPLAADCVIGETYAGAA